MLLFSVPAAGLGPDAPRGYVGPMPRIQTVLVSALVLFAGRAYAHPGHIGGAPEHYLTDAFHSSAPALTILAVVCLVAVFGRRLLGR